MMFVLDLPYTLADQATFWDLNWDLLQVEIVSIPVGLGLALDSHLHTQSLYLF